MLRGGGGDDRLSGDEGIDQLFGGAGGDILFDFEPGDASGDAVIDGGDGFDLLEKTLLHYTGSTTIDLRDHSGAIRNIEQIYFSGGSGINTVIAGDAADRLTGRESGDHFEGLGGDDAIFGNGGDDVIDGGAGNDRLDGEAGDDTLSGGEGDDQISAGFGKDQLSGGIGNDYLDGGDGGDVLRGGQGDDHYLVDSIDDQIIEEASAGNDTITVGLRSFSIAGYAHIENLRSQGIVQSGDTLIGNDLDNIITGGSGPDTLLGGGGHDTLNGSSGNDLLDGGAGGDLMYGFGGNDTYYVDSTDDVVSELPHGGRDVAYSTVSYTLGADQHIEVLSARTHADTTPLVLTGNNLAQEIWGNAGANRLRGGGGNDILVGLGGDDTYIVENAGVSAYESANGGRDVVYSAVDHMLAHGQHVEVLSALGHAGTTPVRLIGNNFAQEIWGNAGANTLDGGGGADLLIGLGGDDTYFVDVAGVRVLESAGNGRDVIYASVNYALAAGQSIEVLSARGHAGTMPLVLTGNNLTQEIWGNAGANTLDGGGGNDILLGLGGDDTYLVNVAGVQIIETAGNGRDVVYASVNYTLGSGQSVEVLSARSHASAATLDLAGNGLANEIWGNAGRNMIDGKGGNDTLIGLGGQDVFAFTTALGAGNVDLISDFQPTVDRIALDDAVFAGLAPGALPAGAFALGSAAQEADDRIIYNPQTGVLLFDADGSGAGTAIHFATITPGTGMTPSEFTVI